MDDGVDVIIFSAVDYNANAEIIDQAAQRGIKIIVIDSDVNSSQVSCRIGTNNLQAGIKAAEAALATDDEELYIGIVNYDVNSANGQQRELGFRQTVEQDPRVKNITTINVLSTTEDARAGAKEMLLSDSRINVVVTFNEWTSLGVGWAIRDLNRADRIQVVAFDSNVVPAWWILPRPLSPERICMNRRARRYCFLLKRKVIDPVQNLTITISKV